MSSRPPYWLSRAVPAGCLARFAGLATAALFVLAVAVGPASTTDAGAASGGTTASPVMPVAVVDVADLAVVDSAARDLAGQRPVALGGGIVAARVSGVVLAQAASIDQVLTNIRNLILGVAGGAALVCWSVAGLRMMFSQGDPGEVAKARSAFRAGAVGFAVVILAPLVLAVLRTVVGL